MSNFLVGFTCNCRSPLKLTAYLKKSERKNNGVFTLQILAKGTRIDDVMNGNSQECSLFSLGLINTFVNQIKTTRLRDVSPLMKI